MIDNFTTKDKYTFKLYPEIKETVILDALIGEFLASAKTGTNTIYADNGIGGTTVTSTAHGLTIEQRITLLGSTSYNGTHDLFNTTVNTYDINVAFVANDASGTFSTIGFCKI